MIDYTALWNQAEKFENVTRREFNLHLTREDICEALKYDRIYLYPHEYYTPTKDLCDVLTDKSYERRKGVTLTLVQV